MPRLTLLLTCSLLCFTAQAADPKKIKYVPPEGFGAHHWGDLRTSFERLPETPVGVGAAWLGKTVKETSFTCNPAVALGPTMNGAVAGCDFQQALNTLRREYESGGFYVLSEYSIEGQGFRFGESEPVVLHPVIYQFCANWFSLKREPPPKFDQMNKFCGMRLMFQSETREELKKLPADYVTNYDRVLEKLLGKFGRPEGFMRRGQVVIETLEGDSSEAGERRFRIWRWCPAGDRGFHTNCPASVTLSLDPATGAGTVLYSTPLLWEYAYARQNNGFKGDRFFRMLHARQ